MTLPSFEAFESEARAAGATEVVARDWPPGAVLEEHTHPFAVSALLVRGQLWLTCGGRTRELAPGDRFTLASDEPHAERYGPDGATYWVGRRS